MCLGFTSINTSIKATGEYHAMLSVLPHMLRTRYPLFKRSKIVAFALSRLRSVSVMFLLHETVSHEEQPSHWIVLQR